MDVRKFRRFFRRIWVVLCTENFGYETEEEMFDRQHDFSSYNPTTGNPMSSCGVDCTGRTIGSSYHY